MDSKAKKLIRKAQIQDDPSAVIDAIGDMEENLTTAEHETAEAIKDLKPTIEHVSTAADFVTGFLSAIKGEKGDQGEKGERGDDGTNGEDGYTPQRGVDYFDGVDGADGEKGEKGDKGETGPQGKQGEKGKDGKNGRDGKDAKEVDAKTVIEKLRALKGNERLDISALRNGEALASMLTKRGGKIDMSDMRWHGGGGDIAVLDEGVSITTKLTSINFVGAGVVATGDGAITVTVSGSGLPAGLDKQVQYNDGGVFGAEAGFEYNKTTDILTAPNIIDSGLTASRAVVSNGSKQLTSSATTDTEIGYVSGVTSAIQTQLNNKQATITGAATTIVSLDLTIDRALISSGTGKVAVSATTATELGYVSGVTSAIQTQLNAKGTGSVTSVSIVSANGFAGSVATATTTPAITLSTTITGFLQGNGTAISAASTTGTGTTLVLQTSPTLITPTLGVATGTSLLLNGTFAASSGNEFPLSVSPTINQSGTAGYTSLLVNTTVSATGNGTKNFFQVQRGGTNTFVINQVGNIEVTQFATTATNVGDVMKWTGAANTGITASQSLFDINFEMGRTVQWATGGITDQTSMYYSSPTWAFIGASTITNASTVYLLGSPSCGANATFTNASILRMNGGPTLTSVAGLSYQSIELDAVFVTLTGSTNVTSVTTAQIGVAAMVLTDSSAVTVAAASGIYIAGAPVASGSLTITNSYSLFVDSGPVRLDGRLLCTQGADVGSANNLVLGTDGNSFEITGTTQINLISNIGWQNGALVILLFTSNPVVKHNQATSTTNITIQLAGSTDFTASAGDTLTLLLSEIGGTQAWREVSRTAI